MTNSIDEEIYLRDLEDCKARDRMQERISIYGLLLLFVVYTTQDVSFYLSGGFLVALIIFAVIKNKQYQDLEKEIKKKCREKSE